MGDELKSQISINGSGHPARCLSAQHAGKLRIQIISLPHSKEFVVGWLVGIRVGDIGPHVQPRERESHAGAYLRPMDSGGG